SRPFAQTRLWSRRGCVEIQRLDARQPPPDGSDGRLSQRIVVLVGATVCCIEPANKCASGSHFLDACWIGNAGGDGCGRRSKEPTHRVLDWHRPFAESAGQESDELAACTRASAI